MGFSSYECNYCSKSILSIHAVHHYQGEIPIRYSRSVWFPQPNQEPVIGTFDGYGNVTDEEGEEHDVYGQMDHHPENVYECMVFHEDCWEISGKPTDFVPSEHAEDQGYFVSPESYP